jgi:hypothetical protein
MRLAFTSHFIRPALPVFLPGPSLFLPRSVGVGLTKDDITMDGHRRGWLHAYSVFCEFKNTESKRHVKITRLSYLYFKRRNRGQKTTYLPLASHRRNQDHITTINQWGSP